MTPADAAEPIPAPAVCAGLWLAEDGTRAMRIARTVDGGWAVTVWRRGDRAVHLDARPARWHPPAPAAATSANALARIGYLQVEVDEPGLGSTYDLMVATRHPAAPGGFEWGPVTAATPRDQVRIFPQGGASYWEAVLGYHDDVVEAIRAGDRWMEPLATWWPAAIDDDDRDRATAPPP